MRVTTENQQVPRYRQSFQRFKGQQGQFTAVLCYSLWRRAPVLPSSWLELLDLDCLWEDNNRFLALNPSGNWGVVHTWQGPTLP